jgi:hypothetical protein
VDSIAKQCVILIDQTKVVPELGLTFPVPVRNGIVLSILSPVWCILFFGTSLLHSLNMVVIFAWGTG